MKKFGLIGYPLSHSFSKKYFSEKFVKESIQDASYELFSIEDIDLLPEVLKSNAGLKGLNVTIPYKQQVIQYLDDMSEAAKKIGAVNVLKVEGGRLVGYNSDYIGFKESLVDFLKGTKINSALILGTGGASKAVRAVLDDLAIDWNLVSRKGEGEVLSYNDVDRVLLEKNKLVINTTPLGMSPNIEVCPNLPYDAAGEGHYFYDLVYNPEETLFMKKAKAYGAYVKNGLEMLHLQAEASWDIWNS
ncbi:shikimate dehydrogenase [Flammeovirgaceae bacterium SG7u.111]|nr:shikimate dehydrogenase [Flammeovirgaceae bacterium SG7u.132]WPO36117.1 shikimate dehydrogenase [Flammeovirgaceae bacterium SG7u.111]